MGSKSNGLYHDILNLSDTRGGCASFDLIIYIPVNNFSIMFGLNQHYARINVSC